MLPNIKDAAERQSFYLLYYCKFIYYPFISLLFCNYYCQKYKPFFKMKQRSENLSADDETSNALKRSAKMFAQVFDFVLY